MTDLLVPSEVAALEPFVVAGLLGAAEVHTAATLAATVPDVSHDVLLAIALAVRAPLHGSVCVDLASVRDTVVAGGSPEDEVAPAADGSSPTGVGPALDDLPWPDPTTWAAAVASSPLVRVAVSGDGPDPGDAAGRLRPLVLDGGLLYLARYRTLERYVAGDLASRAAAADRSGTDAAGEAITRLFAAAAARRGTAVDEGQLAAARAVVDRRLVVVAGGPGTGKTTTVAHLLAGVAVAGDAGLSPVALAAPTGKAAARLTEALRGAVDALAGALPDDARAAVRDLEAVTIHRLLGARPGRGFGHGPGRRLPHRLVVVDEASMVSLSLMAHLLAAVEPDATVVLVGDPHQLASVEAGSVLGDVVGRRTAGPGGAPLAPGAIAGAVRTLQSVHRQAEGSAILDLASAIRDGRGDDVIALLRDRSAAEVAWVDTTGRGDVAPSSPLLAGVVDEILETAGRTVDAAAEGDGPAALAARTGSTVLCALRRGRSGVDGWNRHVDDRLRAAGRIGRDPWYPGRPVMVTRNDPVTGVVNGDVGVVLPGPTGPRAWFPRAEGPRIVDAVRLDRVATQWAMSIHKSQGSEVPHAVVVLPAPPSRILTRELLYTAVTRAAERLTLVASEAAVRAAVDRPIARASGLAARLA